MITPYTLIAVADGGVLAGRDYADACMAAEAGGATSIQVRMKDASSETLLRATERLLQHVSVPVLVNDRIDIALAAGAAGAHLGADDLPIDLARSLPGGAGLIIGTSVGDEAEAGAIAGPVDYWGVGPVFTTAHKDDAGAAIADRGIARLVALAGKVPVVGIGGVTAANCHLVIEAGAVGVAAIGSVFAGPEIENSTSRLRRAIESSLA